MNYFKGTSEFADVVAKLAEKLELGKNCTVNDFELRVKKTRSEKTVSFRIVLSKKLKVKTSNKSPAKVTRQMKRRLQQEQKGHAQMFMPGLPSAPPSAPSSHQEIRPPALRSENYGSQKPNILPKQQSNAPTTSSAVTNLSFAHEDHEKIDSLSEEQKLGTVPTTASAELKISDKNDSLISNKRHKRKPLTSPDKPQRVTAVLTSPALAGAKPGKSSLPSIPLPSRLEYQSLFDLLKAKYLARSNWRPVPSVSSDVMQCTARTMTARASAALLKQEDPYDAALAELRKLQTEYDRDKHLCALSAGIQLADLK